MYILRKLLTVIRKIKGRLWVHINLANVRLDSKSSFFAIGFTENFNVLINILLV